MNECRRISRWSSRGFATMEVLLAVVVCTMAILATVGYLVTAAKQASRQQIRQLALIEASNTLNEWMAKPWSDIEAGNHAVAAPDNLLAQEPLAAVQVTVSEDASDDRPISARRISVSVSWPEMENDVEVTLFALRHRRKSG